jgi:hypothetical protein
MPARLLTLSTRRPARGAPPVEGPNRDALDGLPSTLSQRVAQIHDLSAPLAPAAPRVGPTRRVP